MSGKSLSYLSDVATTVENTPGVTTPILEVEPENGTLLAFLNRVSTGDAEGMPLIADLVDQDGNPMPTDTELILRVERPTDDEPITVSTKVDNISSWNALSTKEQRNEENIDAVKIELNGSRINVRGNKDVFTVEVNSSATINWDQSEIYFVREAVREEAYEG